MYAYDNHSGASHNTNITKLALRIGLFPHEADDDLPDLAWSESEDDTDSDVEIDSVYQEWFNNQLRQLSGVGLMKYHAFNICDPASAGPCFREGVTNTGLYDGTCGRTDAIDMGHTRLVGKLMATPSIDEFTGLPDLVDESTIHAACVPGAHFSAVALRSML